MEYRKLQNRCKKSGLGLGICLLWCLSLLQLQAQTSSFLFDIRSAAYKGLSLYEEGNYDAAIPILEWAVSRGKDKDSLMLKEKLAYAYAISGQAPKAAKGYAELEDEGVELRGQDQLMFANALMGSGQLEEGRKRLVDYLLNTGQQARARKLREMPLVELFRDSIRYTIQPVSLNTEAAEFSPVVVKEGILFVSDRKETGLIRRRFTADGSNNLDLFLGEIAESGEVRGLRRLSSNVNSAMPEGPAAISHQERKLYFSRSGEGKSMQLFQADQLSIRSWMKVEPLPVPVEEAMGHPAVSQNGEQLYFVSDMPGGYGGTDIYRIDRMGGEWSEPRNLGPQVNTAGNEMFPSLSASGSFYFSSNGHLGLGGLDIYQAMLSADSVSEIRNLGAPVNSAGDDFGLSSHESGEWGYFSSNREGGVGKDDIYRLNLHVITLAGKVLDKTNGKGISGAKVVLKQQEKEVDQALTDGAGNYAFKLFPGAEYSLHFSAEEFRSEEQQLSTLQGKRYGQRKDQIALDRKVKMYILGTIRNGEREKAGDAELFIVDRSTARMDTIRADEGGNYELELDVKNQYTFLAKCKQEGAISDFSTPEKGKASLSYYVNFDLKPFITYQVKGKVNFPAEKQGTLVISLTNLHSMVQAFVFTDEAGGFSFEANSMTAYELCLMDGKSTASVLLSSGWEKAERRIQLNR